MDRLKQAVHDNRRYYNEERIQLKLKKLTPIQYRNQSFE
ncbi:IS3 family transposase [Actinobacillus seminis]